MQVSRRIRIFAAALASSALLGGVCAKGEETSVSEGVSVQVSPRDSRYFELSDGRPYIPIGLNLVGAPPVNEMPGVLDTMAANGINHCRLFIAQRPFMVEREKSGVYDPEGAGVLEAFLKTASERGIWVMPCFEHFRDIKAKAEKWSDQPLHHVANGGPYESMEEFLDTQRGIEQFKRKLAWYAERLGNAPGVFAWELWNEMECVEGDWLPWTRIMLPELHRLLPNTMATQSLGSFDRDVQREKYRQLCALSDDDMAQVHRYLDLGAGLEVCHGPVDVLAADAVRELLAMNPGKPVFLSESGAVEANHTGPFKLYEKDTDGIILHDVIWAPFFAGAAGTGQAWHWDSYVEKNNLWRHFARFAEFVHGLDPPAEAFKPAMVEQPRLRVYTQQGKKTFLAWLRDKQNDWRTELEQGKKPETITGATLELPEGLKSTSRFARAFDPWAGEWTEVPIQNGSVALPDFKRSIAIRVP